MDQLPRLGKRELICLLLFTCNYVVSVWRGFLLLLVLRLGCVILLWHSLSLPYEPRREKTGFLHMRKLRRRSAKLISAFVFAALIVRSLYFLNPKFQASSHLLWLYSPVCVGPRRKPRRPVFSKRGSYNYFALIIVSSVNVAE